MGKPGSTKTPCQLGHDETCPNGYHCQATGGQSYDIKTNSYTDATICCPSICDNGNRHPRLIRFISGVFLSNVEANQNQGSSIVNS